MEVLIKYTRFDFDKFTCLETTLKFVFMPSFHPYYSKCHVGIDKANLIFQN